MYAYAANLNFMERGSDHITKIQNNAPNLKSSYKRHLRNSLYKSKT